MIWEMYKKGFFAWEETTAKYLETVMKSPLVLAPSSAMLMTVMKAKTVADKASSMVWSTLGLPTKRDQERSLHALNQIQSRLLDLEEQLARIKNDQKN
jgi:hypothetical protein